MVTMNYAIGANTLLLMIRSAALALTASLSIPLLLGGGVAYATGLSQPEETRLSVEYDGERHFLIRKLSGAEIRELVSDNTLIFIHPRGEEEEYHFSNGQTLNSWSQDDTANAGLWQIEEDEILKALAVCLGRNSSARPGRVQAFLDSEAGRQLAPVARARRCSRGARPSARRCCWAPSTLTQ